MTFALVVLLWQLVLVGGWAASRRLRALERTYRPPCSAKVGQLREQVVELRTDQAFDAQDQARRLRDLDAAAQRAEGDVRELIHRQERSTRAVLARIARLEQALGVVPGPAPARPLHDPGDDFFEIAAERRRVS